MQIPTISVVMPVKNGMPFLVEAVNSVLAQTYANFEFIIIDDGSTDQTFDFLSSIPDKRIRVLKNNGVGLVSALNMGLLNSTGLYIARMDADDICALDRFQVQLNAFYEDQSIDIVCSDIIRIDVDGKHIGVETSFLFTNRLLKQGLLYQKIIKPVIHPTIMMKRAVIDNVGLYRDYQAAEDHDYWLRCIDDFKFYRISQPLLYYRNSLSGVSRVQRMRQARNSMLASLNYLVFKKRGVDMYSDYPRLLEDCGRLFSEENSLIEVHQARFDELKQALRYGKYLHAIWLLIVGLGLSGRKLFPSTRQKIKFAKIEKTQKMLNELITSLREIPAESIERFNCR